MDPYYLCLAKTVPVFSKACEGNISNHGYTHFDFETVGAKIYRCTIAINQTLTGRNIRETGEYEHRMVTVESGLRQSKMRNGYVKKVSNELSVLIQRMTLCYI